MALFSPFVIALLLFMGAAAGFLAGLLGIGGGVILVPLFLWGFPLIEFPESTLVHTALGTSLAIILPTAISSTLGHRKRGNVDWRMVGGLALGGIGGALIGSSLASLFSGDSMCVSFGCMLILVGLKFILFRPHLPLLTEKRPSWPSLGLVGCTGGAFSAFFGIGGGVIAVPLMVIFLRQPIHLALGNSSALIVVSSFFGALSYVFHGWALPDLSTYAMGYVNVPVATFVSVVAIGSARLGVRLATRTPQDKLMKGFAALLILIGSRMATVALF